MTQHQKSEKYDRILDALKTLLERKDLKSISVSEIAQTAGIGKGSIYYYFRSKDDILEALVQRDYEQPMETAKQLASRTDISPFTRMAMIFEACGRSSAHFTRYNMETGTLPAQEKALLHQKYMSHVITELKPVLSKIISQGIDEGQIHFSDPAALSEIVLIILTVELDHSLLSSSTEEIEPVIRALIELLEKGTDNPPGSLNFLAAL